MIGINDEKKLLKLLEKYPIEDIKYILEKKEQETIGAKKTTLQQSFQKAVETFKIGMCLEIPIQHTERYVDCWRWTL